MSQIKGEGLNITDPTTARIRCIEEAVKKGFPVKEDWPDWLTKGVQEVERGGVITPEWLALQDKENSYI